MAAKRRQTRSEWGRRRKLPSGRWQASYQGPDMATHKAPHTFATKLDADAWLQAERKLIDLGTWMPLARRLEAEEAASLTVGEWMDQFHDLLARRPDAPRASTMQNYRDIATNRITAPVTPGDLDKGVMQLREVPLCELTTRHVYAWWDGLQRAYPNTPARNNHAYRRLRAAMEEAVRRQMIPSNPVEVRDAARRVKGEEKYLPEDSELQTLIDRARPRYRALMVLMLHHGLRIGEALAVCVEDVEVDASPPVPYVGPYLPRVTVHVRRNAQRLTVDGRTRMVVQPPKTEAGARAVPIMPRDVPVILHHLANHAPADAATVETDAGPREMRLLSVTTTGRMVMDTSFREMLNRLEDANGITRRIDPHSGRRWLITRLAENGAHLKEIGKLLGQDDLDTILDVYLKVRAERTTVLMDEVSETLGTTDRRN